MADIHGVDLRVDRALFPGRCALYAQISLGAVRFGRHGCRDGLIGGKAGSCFSARAHGGHHPVGVAWSADRVMVGCRPCLACHSGPRHLGQCR